MILLRGFGDFYLQKLYSCEPLSLITLWNRRRSS